MISNDKLKQIIEIVRGRLAGKDTDPIIVWLETVDACRFLNVRQKHIQEVYESVHSRLE